MCRQFLIIKITSPASGRTTNKDSGQEIVDEEREGMGSGQ